MENLVPGNKLLDLNGKTAIVTGGSIGIGAGIVYRLAEAGANVVVANRNQAEAEAIVTKLSAFGWKLKAIKTDVTNEQEIKTLIEQTIGTYGAIDILVNNAGIYPSIPVTQMSLSEFERVLTINLKGVFLTIKYAAEKMIAAGKGGRIINVTSIDALHPSMIGLAAYDASKHGVWGLTKNVALELAPHRIWVNAVAPGGISTPGVAKMQTAMSPPGIDPAKIIEMSLAKIPMKRLGEPDDIGKVVLFLASEMASYLTGSQIVVDGGMLLA
ncbi:SDR family oxidoreductase [Patescibacteria group bacterium]|nr:SDR family oxidoreductase [Patescibacteria group bacterium]MCL5091349.1 SDR family oxidoreductase [Patescibacteria group bacterium]